MALLNPSIPYSNTVQPSRALHFWAHSARLFTFFPNSYPVTPLQSFRRLTNVKPRKAKTDIDDMVTVCYIIFKMNQDSIANTRAKFTSEQTRSICCTAMEIVSIGVHCGAKLGLFPTMVRLSYLPYSTQGARISLTYRFCAITLATCYTYFCLYSSIISSSQIAVKERAWYWKIFKDLNKT